MKRKIVCVFGIIILLLGIVFVFKSTISEEETQIGNSQAQAKSGAVIKEGEEEDLEAEEEMEMKSNSKVGPSKKEGSYAYRYVYLSGAISKPGLYEIQGKMTKGKLISMAGGLLPYAEVSSCNLAEEVQEGEHIHIAFNFQGQPEELLRPKLISLNKAKKEELQTLPGVGPALAERIISYRTEKGAFQSIEDIKKVKGIGEKMYTKLKDRVEL